jgi:hypothetical protein
VWGYVHKTAFTLALATLVTVAGTAVPASAKPAGDTATATATPAAPATGTLGSCQELRAKRTALAAAGATKGACIQRNVPTRGGTAAKDQRPAARSRAQAEAAGQPFRAAANCPEADTSAWALHHRRLACRKSYWLIDVFLLPQMQVIGQILLREDEKVAPFEVGATWTHDYRLTREWAWGDVRGARITGSFDCRGECATRAGFFPWTFIDQPTSVGTTGEFFSTVPFSSAGSGFSQMTVQFAQPGVMGTTFGDSSPNIRCDTIILPEGCVFPGLAAAFGLWRFDFSIYSWVRHISRSLSSMGTPVGRMLTRTTDQSRRDLNNATACPWWFPRPPGQSCDEFPFASTLEGAASMPDRGRTFEGCSLSPFLPLGSPNQGPGWSACMIDATENSRGGGLLVGFYNRERVLDGEQFFIFVF